MGGLTKVFTTISLVKCFFNYAKLKVNSLYFYQENYITCPRTILGAYPSPVDAAPVSTALSDNSFFAAKLLAFINNNNIKTCIILNSEKDQRRL